MNNVCLYCDAVIKGITPGLCDACEEKAFYRTVEIVFPGLKKKKDIEHHD